MQDSVRAVLKGKVKMLNAYIRKGGKKQNKISRRKGVIKIKAYINEIENRESIEKINEAKSCFSDSQTQRTNL